MAELKNNEQVFFDAPVAEMSDNAAEIIQLDPEDTKHLLARTKDDEPQFPIVRVEEGMSKNKFRWTPEMLVSVAEQVNENQPTGYLGHIRPEDERWVFPEPQTIWLKGRTVIEAGKTVLYVKGYNLPKSKIRDYIAAGVAKSTSWRGKADVKMLKGGAQEPVRFRLESIDWSRLGKAAMGADLVTVVAESEGEEEQVEGKDIAKLTVAELKEHNPNVVTLIERDAVAASEAQVAEMEAEKEEGDEAKTLIQKLRELLKLDDKADVLQTVADTITKVEKIGKDAVMERISEVLKKKVPNEQARAAVMRLIPNATVAEMEDIEDDDKFETAVNECIDGDDTVKAVVAEMTGGPAPLSRSRSDNSGNKVGTSGRVRETTVKL